LEWLLTVEDWRRPFRIFGVIAPDGALLGKWLVERYAGREGGATTYFLDLARPALWA
jgi:hypothetical protein